MCCIFQCCGWMIDLIQRMWTFGMSCLIMSSVMGVVVVSSMAGIALGYNYSLAEYIELRETNVSVYIKRGVFDDEVSDDMNRRRAGRTNDENLMTGAPADETSFPSGRRLDDSVIDGDDHNKYEGSLMKLTAKPLHLEQSTDMTSDVEMAESLTKSPMGSLDQMKAIQSLIDSRRAMATGGTTISPLATYGDPSNYFPIIPLQNNPNIVAMTPVDQYGNKIAPGGRRSDIAPQINPARYAVPSQALMSDKVAWRYPKYPDYYMSPTLLGEGSFRISPTYPTAVTVLPMLVRPRGPVKNDEGPPLGAILFPYPYSPAKVETTQPAPLRQSVQEQSDVDQRPDLYNEKVLTEGDELSKTNNQYMPKMESGGKSAEEEYEDEIKGLPVRRRRSIMDSAQVGEGRNPTERNSKHTKNNSNTNTVKNICTSLTTSNEIDGKYEDIFTINKNISIVEVSNDSKTAITISHKDNNTIQHMDANENGTFDLEDKLEIVREHDRNEHEKGQSLLKYLVKSIETKEASLVAKTAPEAGIVNNTAKDIRNNTKISLFESKIIPTKYVSNNFATKLENKQPFNNKGILNSISVRLKDEELVRNQGSSKFSKVLQSILTT